MFSSLEGFLSSDRNSIPSPFIVNGPSPFYLYPRSSIAKTPVRLANNVGIIDSGYRGNIGAFFDIIGVGITSTNHVRILEKHQRVVQICANDLSPFKVILVNFSNKFNIGLFVCTKYKNPMGQNNQTEYK